MVVGYMVRFMEKIKLYYKMIFLNRRSTIAMFLGLGISLALIAESLMFMYSFQFGAFEGFYNGVPSQQFTVSISSYDIRGEIEGSIPRLQEITDVAIENAELSERVLKVDYYLDRGFFLGVNSTSGSRMILPDIHMYGVPSDYFSALSDMMFNGTIPHQVGQVIGVFERATIEATNLSSMGTFIGWTPIFPMSYESVFELGVPAGGREFNISGLITKDVFSNAKGILEDDFDSMTEYFSEEFFITSYTNVANFISLLEYFPGYAQPIGRIAFNLDKIDSFNLAKEIANLQTFSQELTREFENEGITLHIYADLVHDLEDFYREFIIFQLFGLLFITPIVGMALSLTSYSANLMKRRQKRQVSSMLQRGSSQKEVVFILVMQVIELTITALLISFIMGYGFTWLMNKSTGFLNFAGTSVYPSLNLVILYIIIGVGLVLSLIVNAKNVFDMSQITTQEAYVEHQVKKPMWERLYLDLVLIFLGILLWVIVRTQLRGTSAYSFAYGFGTTAPVLLILGSILLATRIYPRLVSWISKKTWKSDRFAIIGLATKRSSRRRVDTTRSLILITLTFTLIFASIVTIQSYQNHDKESARYAIGADILVRGVNTNSNVTKEQVLAIEGVQSATYMKMSSQIITYGQLTYSYIVIGINPEEFAATAFFAKEYLGGISPQNFFSAIKDDNDVVMQRDQLERISSYSGGQVTIWYEKYAVGDVNRTLDVVNEYKYFPRFFTEFPEEGAPVFRFNIIGNYNNLEIFSYAEYSIGGDLLVKVEEGYDIVAVAEEIEEELDRSVENAVDLMGTAEGSLRNTMLFGSLNASFISSLIITVSAIILMILLQITENEREIITLKVLGQSPKQLFNMFLTEALSIVIFGAVLGALVGILAASMFSEILTFDTIIPPTEMKFPPLELGLAISILFITAIIAAALTSYAVFRKDTIKAIKQI
ncbi:MAG: ABC transporter permease [Candidatus Heimdallarchaeota archaeon]|nr:ABC transporter permease [Candidatus Heimdallarchaeota archaeon]